MAMKVISKKQLDSMTTKETPCGMEGCTHDHGGLVYLHPKCHPGEIEVSYTHGTGLLRFGCRNCGATVAFIRVADE